MAMKLWAAVGAGGAALLLTGVLAYQQLRPITQLSSGRLVSADYWRDEPLILSAGLGFDNIIGLPDVDEQTVRQSGGAWYAGARCTDGGAPPQSARTSAASAGTVAMGYRGYADYDDGLPVVFSWPLATETVDPTDFQVTLNTGVTVAPHAAGMYPNWEENERNTVVLFGDFGNRGRRGEVDAQFPVRVQIVADATPLLLVGPGGREASAVGLSWGTDTSPYDQGPSLVGAKLNRIDTPAQGEGGSLVLDRSATMPNDEHALYTEGDFRLRVLTTGGFSPDGVTALRPDMFEQFFRLRARGDHGEEVRIERVGVTYRVAGGSLRVVGLSDLGRSSGSGATYDDCYQEDRDNYIDIILAGDEAAARSITFVEIPALAGGYRAFYNPGGPGPQPFPGVRYTAPGPADMEPVTIALDDPMRVSRR